MANPIDPFALFCAIASAICAFGYLLGACSHRMTAREGAAILDEAGDPLGFRSIMAFQAAGAVLFAAGALVGELGGVGVAGLAF
jgi:hypothetical protein